MTECAQCKAAAAKLEDAEVRFKMQRSEYQERHDLMKRAKEKAELKVGTLERENQMLKRTSAAARARQEEKRQRQLDIEEGCGQVKRWRKRCAELEQQLKEAQAELTQLHAALLGSRDRIRKAEIAAERAIEEASKQIQARTPEHPRAAPEGWQHTITMADHLACVAEYQRKLEGLRR